MTADQGTPTGEAPGARYSPEGERRKREIFVQMRGAMARRRRQRVLARAGAGIVPVLALGVAAWMAFGRAAPATGPLSARDPAMNDSSARTELTHVPRPAIASVDVVKTDPQQVRTILVADARPSIVASIDDRELLATLARAGTNCGIVRAGGRTVVTDNDRGGELRTVSLEEGAAPSGPANAAPVAGPSGAI